MNTTDMKRHVGRGTAHRQATNGGRAKALLVLALALLLGGAFHQAQAAQSGAHTYGPYPAQLVRVIDGDTVELDVAIWPGLVQRISLRLDGVNTPEKRGKGVTACEKAAAAKASEFTSRLLAGARSLIISGVRRGKYAGRVLGRLSADGRDLGQALIQAGMARPYDGGKRDKWC